MKNKHIAVVGLGYVGLPLALVSAKKGYKVTGIDTQEKKITMLKSRTSPIPDVHIQKLLQEIPADAIEFTSDFNAISDTSIIIICVPTPVYGNHTPNLEPVENASRSVGAYLKKDQLVILESTVNPGVSEEVVIPILEKASGLIAGKDFYIAHCPERINPGDSKWNVENISRVVGSLEEIGLERAYNFYKSIISGEVRKMGSLKEAEAVKIVENSFRDINIAFVNELAMSFSRLGIDVMNVIKGAATKPFGFLSHFPGCGVGGHCIPVDPYYLIDYAEKNGFFHQFLSLARRINNHMPEFTVEQLALACNDAKKVLNGSEVAVLGLAYKPGISDCRESPSFEIIKHLKEAGANVRVYDPYVPDLQTVSSIDEALKDASYAVIATAHPEFRSLTPSYFSDAGIEIVVDGCNCLPKDDFVKAGIVYRGIGR